MEAIKNRETAGQALGKTRELAAVAKAKAQEAGLVAQDAIKEHQRCIEAGAAGDATALGKVAGCRGRLTATVTAMRDADEVLRVADKAAAAAAAEYLDAEYGLDVARLSELRANITAHAAAFDKGLAVAARAFARHDRDIRDFVALAASLKLDRPYMRAGENHTRAAGAIESAIGARPKSMFRHPAYLKPLADQERDNFLVANDLERPADWAPAETVAAEPATDTTDKSAAA